jgi:NAD(P)H-hydrate repair Nnr-like enzyme with NAD(P)H-hydrate dehydratase domain
VAVVRGRGGTVVGGVGNLLVGLAARLVAVLVGAVPAPVLAVVAAVQAVRHVAGRARRRVVAEEVVEDPPEPVHRNGL